MELKFYFCFKMYTNKDLYKEKLPCLGLDSTGCDVVTVA